MVATLKMPHALSEKTGAERRIFPRKEFHSRIQGQRLDNTIPARQFPHLSLATRDVSMGGMSAISDVMLDKGERINVFFPPLGAQRGWDASGRVIRCEPSAMGYRLALEFETMPMAA